MLSTPAMDQSSKLKERERLADLITEWNANRLELFEISLPDENLEFHGVMRFFFQDEGAKVATKCLRVSSMETTTDVIETLVEKFRPDMKMLSLPTYYLYELNATGDERVLKPTEHPLIVQLNWSKDDREGRFLLRNASAAPTKLSDLDAHDDAQNFKRKLSKREKKEQKKKGSGGKENDSPSKKDEDEPTSVFARTKSNSEAVMRRRRQMKLENKFLEIKQQGDEGGLLKVYGESLNADVPYKSLLLSVTDSAAYVVREMLDKYGLLTQEDPDDYCLVQVFNAHAGEIGGGLRPQEHLVESDECPLAILQSQVSKGNITFHVRRRDGRKDYRDEKMPHLLELNLDGSDMKKPKKHLLHLNITEVGSIASPSTGQHLRLIGPTILPHHAVIAHISGVVTVTPTSREAETYVEGQQIYDTTVIQHGKIVRFGHHHAFRFIDPKVDERLRKGGERIEDYHAGSIGPGLPLPSENGPPAYTPRLEDVLPAGLEFRDEGEDNFLQAIVGDVSEGVCQFKLAPAYAVYLATRYRVDRVRPGAAPEEHFSRVQTFAAKVAYFMRDAAARCQNSPQDLAFWMSNASEVLHFFKQDRDIGPNSGEAQDVLADAVQDIFRDLVYIMQTDLNSYMPSFLVDSDDDDAGNVLHVLSSAMSLLRRCRVNAALTIQLFSQLFHFINMWLFNKLVTEPHLRLMTRQWGIRIKRRLFKIEAWAEKQGLELAADCHLCRISQAAHLLQSSKWNRDDVSIISSACFKLNSLQMRALLSGYIPQGGEPRVSPELIENLVSIAANTADEQTRAEGHDVRLEEDLDLQLPFLLPEDGYSCDVVKDVPPGLQEFLQPLVTDGLCRLTPLPSQTGAWTVFMPDHENNQRMSDEGTVAGMPPNETLGPAAPDISTLPLPQLQVPPQQELPRPEVINILLNKVNGSMGLSIVAAKGENQQEKGIYIRSVVPGGAAALDGRLQAGDQLLQVDGKSLVGLSQELAAEYMKDTRQTVSLVVAKQSAVYHGLATFLSQPSPVMAARGKMSGPSADIARGGGDSRLRTAPFQQPLQASKSTPLLNVNNGDMHSVSAVSLRPGPETSNFGIGNSAARSQLLPAPGPFGSYDTTSRSTSQPELVHEIAAANAYTDQPNYQNYPGAPGGTDYRERMQQQPQASLHEQHVPGVILRHPSASSSGPSGSTARPGSQYDIKGPNMTAQQQLRTDIPQRPRSEFVDPTWWVHEHDDSGGSRAGGQPIYQNQSNADMRLGSRGPPEMQGRQQPAVKPGSDSFGSNLNNPRSGFTQKGNSNSPEESDLPPPPQSLMQPYYNYENQPAAPNRYDDGCAPQSRHDAQPAPWSQQAPKQVPFGQQGGPRGAYDPPGGPQQPGPTRDPAAQEGSAGVSVPVAGRTQQPPSPGYSRGPPSPGYQQQVTAGRQQAVGGGTMPYGGMQSSGPGPAMQRPGSPQSLPSAYGRSGQQQESTSRASGLPPLTLAAGQRPVLPSSSAPAWQREDEERRARQIVEEGARRRDDLIADLQSRPRRTAEEEEKLRRLVVDQEFERRAQEASHRKDTSASDDEKMPGQSRTSTSLARGDGYGARQEPVPKWSAPGSSSNSREPLFRGTNDARPELPPAASYQASEPGAPSAVKLETLPSKTIVFKPAYRDEPLKRDVEKPLASVTYKPGVKPSGSPTSPRLQQKAHTSSSQLRDPPQRADSRSNMQPVPQSQQFRQMPQEEARRQAGPQANSAPSGPVTLSFPEKEALKSRLDEELKEKQRRDEEDRRRSQPPPPQQMAPPFEDDTRGRWWQQDAQAGQQLRRDTERDQPKQPSAAGAVPSAGAPNDRRELDVRNNGHLPRPGGAITGQYNPAVTAPLPPDRSSSFNAQQRYGPTTGGFVGASVQPQPYGGPPAGVTQPYSSGAAVQAQPLYGGGPAQQSYSGVPGSQQSAYNSGPLQQQQPYSGGPSAQQPYSGGPSAQQPYSGGPSAQQPYSGGPSAQQQFGGGPSALQQPYGGGPSVPQQPYGGGPSAPQPYGGGSSAQQPYGNGPGGQAPYGGAPASQTFNSGPYDQRYGNQYDRRGVLAEDSRTLSGSATLQLGSGRADSADGRKGPASSAVGNLDIGSQKKSVSFNSNLETEIPLHSPAESMGAGAHNYQNFGGPLSGSYNVSGSTALQSGRYADTSEQQYSPAALLSDGRVPEAEFRSSSMSVPPSLPTPGVIGTQEVYRDPRMRIEAQRRSQTAGRPEPEQPADRLSFRDKMKFFATTAGENTPQERPRSSKTQRMLEDHLMYTNEN